MKQAFTLIELIMVIVVVGILAATVSPAFQRDTNAEAAQQFMSHVRYTQHLAMVEDKFDPNDANWFKRRWQIRLNSGVYAIVSDRNNDGTLAQTDIATDPLDSNKRLDGGLIASDDNRTQSLDLATEYGATIATSGGCNGASPLIISFDHLGRPLLGDISSDTSSYPASRLLTSNCNLTFSGGSEADIVVTITSETGYTFMN